MVEVIKTVPEATLLDITLWTEAPEILKSPCALSVADLDSVALKNPKSEPEPI